MKKQNYIFCRDFWFGEDRQSESILNIYKDIPNLKFCDITKQEDYDNISNSNIIFIGEIPERLNINLSNEFLRTNKIFFHYHLESFKVNELKQDKYSNWIYLLFFDHPEINNFLENELKYQTLKFKFYLPIEKQVKFEFGKLGYWNRTNLFHIDIFNRIIEKLNIREVYLYDYPNGGYPYLDNSFLENIHCDKIYYLSGKENRTQNKYKNFMSNCNIYLCPRRVESCGISNLEQMNRGCFMIGMDLPSMNNYIIHKQTGFLINNDFSNLHDLENINTQDIGANARIDCIKNFNKFKREFKIFTNKYFL